MANIKNNAAAQETQRRLLDAAGEEFAEKGFHSATVKDITTRAGASVAAVNYHFGDKASLYDAVLRRIEQDAMAIRPPSEILIGDAEARFVAYLSHLTAAKLDRNCAPWERILLAREFAKPSPSMTSFLERCVVPIHAGLAEIIAEFVGLEPTDERVILLTLSMFAQTVYFMQHGDHIPLLHPSMESRPSRELVIDHVVAFSLGALHAARARIRASGHGASE